MLLLWFDVFDNVVFGLCFVCVLKVECDVWVCEMFIFVGFECYVCVCVYELLGGM